MTTTSLYTIRALTKDDWESFSAIRLEALEKHPDVYSSNYDKESKYAPEEWQSRLNQQGKCFFGTFNGNELIGICGVFLHDYDFPHIHASAGAIGVMGSLYIKPAYRGYGLANKLGHACIHWSIGFLPWQSLAVAHRDGNMASQGIIKGRGFKLTEIERNKTWPDGKIIDQYWYTIDLQECRMQNRYIVPG
jgi:RimJ/RimL family protein N-acetyltransferase